jgi:HD-GYP domain-containing protein (c-di-GMP phosphodiesterase class II)
MRHGLSIPMQDMVMCLTNVVDLVSPAVDGHHKRTAYIALGIASELGMDRAGCARVVLAGMLHDIGALSLRDRLAALEFDAVNPEKHAVTGYRLLSAFEPFRDISGTVRFHHQKWMHGRGAVSDGLEVPRDSHILHLADRVDALIDRRRNILDQAPDITKKITRGSGGRFVPEMVEAFRAFSGRESFWLNLSDITWLTSQLAEAAGGETVRLDTSGVMQLAGLFSRVIDFRSRYTAVHSSGVAALAESLAGYAGMPHGKHRMMRLAGYLHDIGKLAVPAEILDKPARLTQSEFSIIKAHTFYTHRVLGDIRALEEVRSWASYHHERIDGRGYPFHRSGDGLCLGSRVMSVADVFTALAEPRPYRPGMERPRVMRLMGRMAKDGALDPELVGMVDKNYDELELACRSAQYEARSHYENLNQPSG